VRVIAQSQADVERGFSDGKNLLTIRQTNMDLDTFHNKRYILDGMTLFSSFQNVPITSELIDTAKRARKHTELRRKDACRGKQFAANSCSNSVSVETKKKKESEEQLKELKKKLKANNDAEGEIFCRISENISTIKPGEKNSASNICYLQTLTDSSLKLRNQRKEIEEAIGKLNS
jgi:hypothetical protein